MIALSTIGTHPPELRAATTTVATTATTSPDWMVVPAHTNPTLYTFQGLLVNCEFRACLRERALLVSHDFRLAH